MRDGELNDLYCSPNINRVIKSRIMRWAGHVERMGEKRAVYRVFVGKPDGDTGLDGNIILRWIFRKWNVGGMDWIELAQDTDRRRALVHAVMNLRVPQNAGNFLTGCKPVSF